jgi:hypothetical protein
MGKNQTKKSILFLTNDTPNKGDSGNQRTNFFINTFKGLYAKDYEFNLRRIDLKQTFGTFQSSQIGLPFAADIEFSMEILSLLDSINSQLVNLISKVCHSDVVVIDNCYLAVIAIEAKKLNPELKIVYISHNIESSIKKTISQIQNWPIHLANAYIEHVSNVEDAILRMANLTICCSENDKNELQTRGSTHCFVLPNGAVKHEKTTYTLEDIQGFLSCQKYVLFVASGHPPNVDGFLSGIGLDFGFLEDNCRVVIAGSSGHYISEAVNATKYKETFLKRGSDLGFVDDDLLSALYCFASATLLPIFKGGGTNIKTAEAFINSKLVLATEFSLRGFDHRLTSQTPFKVLNNKDEFRVEINKALSLNNLDLCELSSESFTWSWLRDNYENDLLVFMNDAGIF